MFLNELVHQVLTQIEQESSILTSMTSADVQENQRSQELSVGHIKHLMFSQILLEICFTFSINERTVNVNDNAASSSHLNLEATFLNEVVIDDERMPHLSQVIIQVANISFSEILTPVKQDVFIAASSQLIHKNVLKMEVTVIVV